MKILVQKIIEKEKIDLLGPPVKLAHGEENENYLVLTPDEKLVLRILNKKRTCFLENPDAIEVNVLFESDVIKKLSALGFAVPQIKKTGRFNDKFYQFQSFLEGTHVTPDALNKEQAQEIGRILAEIHSKTKIGKPILEKARGDLFSFAFEDKVEKKYGKKILMRFGKKFFDRLVAKKEGLKKSIKEKEIKPNCIIHNDFFYWNIKFEGNKISGILDFDESCIGNSNSDLATTLTEFFLYGNKSYPKNYSEILSSYSEIIPIENMALLKELMKHRTLYTIFYALHYFFERKTEETRYLKKIKLTLSKLDFLEGEKFGE